MGAATARRLSRDRKVVLFERFHIGHKRGSSHGASRIFRYSYPDAQYVEMAMESLGLWRDLEKEADRSLLFTTGGLDRGKGVTDNGSALETCGAPYEMLDGADASKRFPEVSLPSDEPVLYQPDGGIMLADEAVRALVDSARSNGAEIRTEEPVVSLAVDEDSVTVTTGSGTWKAPVAVVTAGGWARGLLSQVGIDLPVRVTRETVAYFSHPLEMFCTLVEWQTPAIYALPSPGDGIKAGEHIAGPSTDPDDEGGADEESIARVTEWVTSRFPKAAAQPHRAETCMYTKTDDESFILERHGSIVVGSACSGHGFKFAPLVGKRLAALCD
jgi:sarcosine oxidase